MSAPQPDDLRQVRSASRPYAGVAAIFRFVVAGVLLVGGLIVGLLLYLFVKDGAIPAAVFAGAALVAACVVGWKGYRDITGDPFVLSGRLVEKVRRTTSSEGSRSVTFHLQIEVREAYAIDANGRKRPLPRRVGRQEVASQPRLYERLGEGEEVEVVCLATGEAFAQLGDLQPGGGSTTPPDR